MRGKDLKILAGETQSLYIKHGEPSDAERSKVLFEKIWLNLIPAQSFKSAGMCISVLQVRSGAA
jgi:hypothetical protein